MSPATVHSLTPPHTSWNADTTRIYADSKRRRWAVRATALAALAIYAGYLAYRIRYTLNPEAPIFSGLILFAELHGFLSLIFFFHQVWGVRTRIAPPPPAGLRADIFITTYNEELDLLRQTVRAAIAVRYPHRTFILDDGRRETVRALAEELGCQYITRDNNAHAKAGNWNNAFRQTDGDVIVTFDADHVPRPEFLERTLGFFADPRVALVQVPQQYHNLDSVQHRVNWGQRRLYNEQDSFFNLVMPGKDHWNAAFFCGTGALIRRTALEPHGGIMTDTITEDLHTSVVLHSEGWKSVYLNEVLVTGLAPSDLRAFEIQRLRWAEGNLKVMLFINPLTASGLTVHQRISYAASLFHWTVGIPKFIYYMAPPWMLFTGTFPIANYDGRFLAVYAAFLTALIVSYEVASRGRGRLLLDELYSMVSFFTLTRAVKRLLFGRGAPVKFEVTAKKGSAHADLRPVMPHLVLLSFSVMAIAWSVMGLGFGVSDDRFGAGTAIFWTLYNMALMLMVVRIGTRPAEKRDTSRYRAHFAVEIDHAAQRDALGVTEDISEGGCSLLWPSPLERGERLMLVLHFGPQVRRWPARITKEYRRQADGWHRYGVAFAPLTQADVDLVHDSIFALVVPALFQQLSSPPLVVRTVRALRALGSPRHSRARRQSVNVPLRLSDGLRTLVLTARDVSATGLSVLSTIDLPAGAIWHLTMRVPGREWQGAVRVVRSELRPSRDGFETWMVGLRFDQAQSAEDMAHFALDERKAA